jgi:uncharacterized protein YbcV (DUF1398 family)
MTPQLLEQCTTGAFDGTVPFPETIRRLAADGVEWYSANLILGGKSYFGSDWSHRSVPWPGGPVTPIADRFQTEGVRAAIRASQARTIDYATFLRRIAEAGVVYYTVHLRGRKAVYFGRCGEAFTEPFPPG